MKIRCRTALWTSVRPIRQLVLRGDTESHGSCHTSVILQSEAAGHNVAHHRERFLFRTAQSRYKKAAKEAHLVDIHGGDSLGVGEDLLVGVAVEQLDALVPLVHVVRVLTQHDAGQKLRPPLHQVLEPCQPGVTWAVQSAAD